jgi:hypothetical protein
MNIKTIRCWFAAKRTVLSTWEARLVLAGFIVLVGWNFVRLDSLSHSASDTLLAWVPETLIMTLVLVWIRDKKRKRSHSNKKA